MRILIKNQQGLWILQCSQAKSLAECVWICGGQVDNIDAVGLCRFRVLQLRASVGWQF
jgi:hypothetical protein